METRIASSCTLALLLFSPVRSLSLSCTLSIYLPCPTLALQFPLSLSFSLSRARLSPLPHFSPQSACSFIHPFSLSPVAVSRLCVQVRVGGDGGQVPPLLAAPGGGWDVLWCVSPSSSSAYPHSHAHTSMPLHQNRRTRTHMRSHVCTRSRTHTSIPSHTSRGIHMHVHTCAHAQPARVYPPES
jgi:hypothetical protein